MERRSLGKTGLEVSAQDAGLNIIDTAECDAGSGELIGRAVGHRRETFHLFTKYGHSSGLLGED